MKKCVVLLSLGVCLAVSSSAQSSASKLQHPGGTNQQIALNVSLPFGRFAESHAAGVGLSYNWSHHRFGDNINARKLIGFTAQAGFDYFFGKNDTLLGHTFKNRNAMYVQVMPGIIYNPGAKTAIMLLAGPSLGIYNDASSISFSAGLNCTYHISPTISAGPSLVLRKHEYVDIYWTAGIGARILIR
ncbi:MAG: hypothetical protein ABW007_10385 [Chitinophagaceae bacterium]